MMPFTAAKLGAVQGSAIVVNGLQAARLSRGGSLEGHTNNRNWNEPICNDIASQLQCAQKHCLLQSIQAERAIRHC
jgi:hypothetical protein